ncbi:hypothetical protein K8I28_12560 [bacterium]|nr:hypothetical protein [bacterium]
MSDHSHADGYEKKDTRAKPILIVAVISMVILATFFVLLNEYFIMTKEAMVEEMVLKPQSAQLRELRAQEAEILNSYSIVDESSGVYRIPISRAMELIDAENFEEQKKN